MAGVEAKSLISTMNYPYYTVTKTSLNLGDTDDYGNEPLADDDVDADLVNDDLDEEDLGEEEKGDEEL